MFYNPMILRLAVILLSVSFINKTTITLYILNKNLPKCFAHNVFFVPVITIYVLSDFEAKKFRCVAQSTVLTFRDMAYCLTRRCHDQDDKRRPSLLSRLGTGKSECKAVVELAIEK